jgi:hypothetical protein
VFDLFEAGLLREGLEKEVPGGATLVLKLIQMKKSALMQAAMEVGISFGSGVAATIFGEWLVEKWRKNGKKHISAKIENRLYQFEEKLIAKALDDAMVKLDLKKPSAKAATAVSKTDQSSGDQKGRKTAQS